MSKLPDMDQTQLFFISKIEGKTPFVAIRFGLFEYKLCYQYIEKIVGIRTYYSDYIKYHIAVDAGMDNDEKSMDFYSENILRNLKMVDAIGFWRNYPEKIVFSNILGSPYIFNINDIYPFPVFHNGRKPYWQKSLADKTVLFVTAFSESIRKQYAKKELIWSDDTFLPEFNLITYQAPVTHGKCTTGNWKECFETMKKDVLKIKFDIAFISCGSYGMPLALELKKAGKIAIQWGGCYQLWFGIMGNRWESNDEIKRYMNVNWCYPSKRETPLGAELVNNGSYWRGV